MDGDKYCALMYKYEDRFQFINYDKEYSWYEKQFVRFCNDIFHSGEGIAAGAGASTADTKDEDAEERNGIL